MIQKDARRVFVDENKITIAQNGFELLLFLVQNPNRVFGREELFEKISVLDALGDSATVTVHIGRLRGKIEVEPSNPQYFEIFWGEGYRLKV